MPTLYFIRHGQTDWNAAARLQGQTDTLLNALGEAQARENGARLANHFAENGIDHSKVHFVCSPLLRARHTAAHVAGALGLRGDAFSDEPRVAEIKFGSWEGKTRPEIRDLDPLDYALYERQPWDFQPPGAESYKMLSDRVLDWLSSLERTTVCVSHGGVMRVLRRHFEAVPDQEAPLLAIPQDQIYCANVDGVTWI